jgi:hypothetical protein
LPIQELILHIIPTGASWLLQQDSIEFNIERHELTVNSPSGKTYHANGACQCEAFQSHQACWHRAGARLCRRAIEAQQLQAELQRTSVAARLARARAAVDVLWA